ncbi:MAG: hypothetical protein CMJ78_09390 [Planctomycetaceae bacterium]|nr:hypothetical protein [Planctomycetaceae bacterium]
MLCVRHFALLLLIAGTASVSMAQDEADPAEAIPKPPTIPDEPKTVDPANHVPEQLAKLATVEFADKSLRDIAAWIQTEQKIPVLFDTKTLNETGVALGEPVTDRLQNEPVYLLLNRLRGLNLAWYVEDNILRITTTSVASERMSTQPYNVGDLLDGGFKQAAISNVIQETTSGPWEEESGEGGGLEWLGDVLFVRQTDNMHREVNGLLAALRKHARRTFTLDPPQHGALREKLAANVSVNFNDTPLSKVVEDLATQSKADIRLEPIGLRNARVRDREPITLKLSDRPLSTTLDVLLADLELRWILRDGVLWLTDQVTASRFMKTAVFDVRDLCRDSSEADALGNAIQTQTSGPWLNDEGNGGSYIFAKPGALVVRQTETILEEIHTLMATYRKALLASKPRERSDIDEVSTRYYRMHINIAKDLSVLLPLLVEPKSWINDEQPNAVGTVMKLSSRPDVVAVTKEKQASAVLMDQAVLIIRQTRSVHEKISDVIARIESGDTPLTATGGGSGFGGGFFSVDEEGKSTRLRKKSK